MHSPCNPLVSGLHMVLLMVLSVSHTVHHGSQELQSGGIGAVSFLSSCFSSFFVVLDELASSAEKSVSYMVSVSQGWNK